MTMKNNLRRSWDDYSAPLRAILDEYARAIRQLETVVRPISQRQYLAATAPGDPDYPNIALIMEHVIGAANVYVDYFEDAIAGCDRGRRKHVYHYDTPDNAMASVSEAFERTVAALHPVRHYIEDDMLKVEMVTRWHERYNLEQILEHAIVHILRHRRQIENRLNDITQL